MKMEFRNMREKRFRKIERLVTGRNLLAPAWTLGLVGFIGSTAYGMLTGEDPLFSAGVGVLLGIIIVAALMALFFLVESAVRNESERRENIPLRRPRKRHVIRGGHG